MARVTANPRPGGMRRTLDIEVASESHSYQIVLPGATCVVHNTLSLLGNCTPGWHPALFKHYIRRVRMASDSPLVKICRDNGYPVEEAVMYDGSIDRTVLIVCFPCRVPDGTLIANELDAISQLRLIARLQREWSDNSVSATVYYKPDELPAIREYLDANYAENIKSISFMLHVDHGFKQAPYEEITPEAYDALARVVRPIRHADIAYSRADAERAAESDCPGGACPVR